MIEKLLESIALRKNQTEKARKEIKELLDEINEKLNFVLLPKIYRSEVFDVKTSEFNHSNNKFCNPYYENASLVFKNGEVFLHDGVTSLSYGEKISPNDIVYIDLKKFSSIFGNFIKYLTDEIGGINESQI